jgi:hypothetical protein
MFKNFSYWEIWPSSTGHEPSLKVLGRLARLYECGVSDLVADLPDYHHHDRAHRALATVAPICANRPEEPLATGVTISICGSRASDSEAEVIDAAVGALARFVMLSQCR